MKKLFVMAAMVLSSVGAFAQQAAGTTTIQPKVGLNVATIADDDWKAGFAAGAELQYQATDNVRSCCRCSLLCAGLQGQGRRKMHDDYRNLMESRLYQCTYHIELLSVARSRSQGWYCSQVSW